MCTKDWKAFFLESWRICLELQTNLLGTFFYDRMREKCIVFFFFQHQLEPSPIYLGCISQGKRFLLSDWKTQGLDSLDFDLITLEYCHLNNRLFGWRLFFLLLSIVPLWQVFKFQSNLNNIKWNIAHIIIKDNYHGCVKFSLLQLSTQCSSFHTWKLGASSLFTIVVGLLLYR